MPLTFDHSDFMLVTFILLLTGHLLGDFVCQTNSMVANKKKPLILVLHVAVVTLVTGLILGVFHPLVLAIVFATHLLLDALKTYRFPDNLRSFLIDQGLHLLVIFVIALKMPEFVGDSFWLDTGDLDLGLFYLKAMITLSAFILLVPAGGTLISKATQRFSTEIGDSLDGLKDGGKIIGYLERSLVFLFILVGHPGGIGFLVAAKSILRFGDIKDPGQRKVTEYIIIGTFLSFGWALLVSVLAQKAFEYFSS
ncbi:DUF3307 domain-containing protein [Roseibacillus persicicus]